MRKTASKPSAKKAAQPRKPSGMPKAPKTKPVQRKRQGTKIETLLALLRKPEGTTVDEMAKATGWQAHSVRGCLSGAIKKKMGLKVLAERKEDGTRYAIKEG
jgi:hypothetical protein